MTAELTCLLSVCTPWRWRSAAAPHPTGPARYDPSRCSGLKHDKCILLTSQRNPEKPRRDVKTLCAFKKKIPDDKKFEDEVSLQKSFLRRAIKQCLKPKVPCIMKQDYHMTNKYHGTKSAKFNIFDQNLRPYQRQVSLNITGHKLKG